MGVDLLIAWVVVTFLLLIFLVVTRLVCETGLPLITAGWSLPSLLVSLFGAAALGPTPLIFIYLLGSTVVLTNATQLIMPYMATSLKILDDNDVNLRKFAISANAAILIALVAGFAAVLVLAYTGRGGSISGGERALLDQPVRKILTLADWHMLDAAEAASGFEKLSLIRSDGRTVSMVLIGLATVLATYVMRFRYAKWPLHPLFFLLLGSWMGRATWSCFLLGCGIKTLVVNIGGGRVYRDVKPLFIGLILGESLCVVMILIVGFIYYQITGNSPVGLWFAA
jgi:hypothetical protein